MEVHHRGVVDGKTADDPDQVKPVLLNKTLEIQTRLNISQGNKQDGVCKKNHK